jgi:hypothetical protein
MTALKTVGGNLNCAGNKAMDQNSFPNLETVGEDIILCNAGFTRLPQKLKTINGNAVLSKNDPASLLEDLEKAKANGILKGDIFFND